MIGNNTVQVIGLLVFFFCLASSVKASSRRAVDDHGVNDANQNNDHLQHDVVTTPSDETRALWGGNNQDDFSCPEGFAKLIAEWDVCLSDYPYHHFRWDLYTYPSFFRLAHEYTSSFPSNEVVNEKFLNSYEACLDTTGCYELDLLWAKVPLGVLDVSQLTVTYNGTEQLIEEYAAYDDTSWIFSIFGDCDEIRRRELLKGKAEGTFHTKNIRPETTNNNENSPKQDRDGFENIPESSSLPVDEEQGRHLEGFYSLGKRGKKGGSSYKPNKHPPCKKPVILWPGKKKCPWGQKRFTASWAGLNFTQETNRRLAIDLYEYQDAGTSEDEFKSIKGEETDLDPRVIPRLVFPDSFEACVSVDLCYEFDVIWAKSFSVDDVVATYNGETLTFQDFGGGQIFTRFPVGCSGTNRTLPFDPQDYIDEGLEF